MAKQQIIGAVRIGDNVFTAGQEEDLAKELSAEQIERLTAEGVIAGFGKTTNEVASDEPAKGKGKSKT